MAKLDPPQSGSARAHGGASRDYMVRAARVGSGSLDEGYSLPDTPGPTPTGKEERSPGDRLRHLPEVRFDDSKDRFQQVGPSRRGVRQKNLDVQAEMNPSMTPEQLALVGSVNEIAWRGAEVLRSRGRGVDTQEAEQPPPMV